MVHNPIWYAVVVVSAQPYFSADYFIARDRFRAAVSRAGGHLNSLAIGAAGPSGEPLTIEIGWFGGTHPAHALVHVSGTHGIEGFVGSAIQLQWLAEGVRAGVSDERAIVIVHAVNPYGMAWLRRVNAHNVDLNRNCLAPEDSYAGAPDGYAALDDFLNPPEDASDRWFYVRAAWLIRRHGISALKQTVAGGQYVNPNGLFYGGSSLEEEPRLLLSYFSERMVSLKRLMGIDVHTGLGPFAADTLIVNQERGSVAFDSLRETFGERVTSSDPARGPAYRAKGTFDMIFRRAAPDAQLHYLVQEFGTYHVLRVIRALRTENRLYHLHLAGNQRDRIGAELLNVFCPRNQSWRSAVLTRGRAVIDKAMDMLARDSR